MFRFGHFSDIHFKYNLKTYDTETMREMLIERLKDLPPLNALFITGDIFYQGDTSEQQIEFIKEYIEEMATAARCDLSQVYICAGNHDLKRGRERATILRNIIEVYKESDGNQLITEGYSPIIYDNVVLPFNRICEKITGIPNPEKIHRIIPLEDINLIILNTSIFAGQTYPNQKDANPDLENTNLFICDEKFLEFKKEVKKIIDKDKPVICLGHHSPDCFEKEEKGRLVKFLSGINCDLYLCGHIHVPSTRIMEDTKDTRQITCGGPFKDDARYNIPSFVIGEYDPDTQSIDASLYNYINSWQLYNQALSPWEEGHWNRKIDRLTPPVVSLPSKKKQINKPSSLYNVSQFFRGRENQVNELIEYIINQEIPIILVHGVAGIGKTEICKAAINRIQISDRDFLVPYIDLTGCKEIKDVMGKIATEYEISLSEISPDKIFSCLQKHFYNLTKEKKQFAFLDNYEEIYYLLSEEQRDTLSDQLHGLANAGLRFLISSQAGFEIPCHMHIYPIDHGKKRQNILIDDFMELESTKLFCDVLNRKKEMSPAEKEALRDLLLDIMGHPLSILLAAYSGRNCASLIDLKKSWPQIEAHIPGDKSTHKSLSKALTLTWNILKNSQGAVLRWAIHSLSLFPLDNEILSEFQAELSESVSEEKWLEGGRMLFQFGLLESTDDNQEEMLRVIKNSLSFFDKTAIQPALTAWINVCSKMLKNGDNTLDSDYDKLHDRALTYFPQCLYLAEYCLENNLQEPLPKLLKYMENYYFTEAHRSVALLRNVLKKTDSETFNYCLTSWKVSELLRYMGQIGPAMTACKKAEKICLEKKCKSVLAYVLQTKGKILKQKGQMEDAMTAYVQAEQLFRETKNSSGLANITYYMGDLRLETGDLRGAKKLLGKAEKLTQDVPDPLQTAYVWESLGNVFYYFCNTKEALKKFDDAKKIFDSQKDKLGSAYVLIDKGTLLDDLGRLTEAMDSFNEAERLFNDEENEQGRAYVLQCKGDVFCRNGHYEEAMMVNDKAAILFKNEQDNLGRANALLSKGTWLKDNGQYYNAVNVLNQAEKIYRRRQVNISLSDVLQVKGEICSIKGRYSEAAALYDESENICQNSHYSLGLAHLYKRKGDLYCLNKAYTEAENAYSIAEKLYRKGEFNTGLADIELSTGTLLLIQEQYTEAVKHLQKALPLFQKIQEIAKQCSTLLELEFCKKELRDKKQASEYGTKSAESMSILPKAVQKRIRQEFNKLIKKI